MGKIRVLLGNHPMIIPDADTPGGGRTKAAAVVLAWAGAEEPGLCSPLVSVYPDLTILAVSVDLQSAFLEQMCPRRRTQKC